MASVALAVTDGMPLLELAAACAIFGTDRPDLVDSWYDFTVCAPAGAQVGGWLQADTPHGLDELAKADTVIVPACQDVDQPQPADLIEAVRAAHDAGARVASICTGAFTLAAAGLLDGRRATTHWLHADALARRHPEVEVDPRVLYIDEGSVLTSAGRAAGIDLCLHMVRTDHGTAIANGVARRLVVAPHRSGGQAQFITAPVPPENGNSLTDVLAWALEELHRPLTVTDLARRAHMSPRNLGRHFAAVTGTTPLQWLLTQRLHRAQEFLERTDDSVDRIAAQVGMGSGATLRRHFNRAFGVPPDTYRRTFRVDGRVDGRGDRAGAEDATATPLAS
ncbi:helix-turn-helix domain-containing protein [Streptomyces sp. CA-181903]|uniref:helix-turn-helix domain-containing protein n=1 Tax=Streptomyces sp. CA-181903 TaxID=3240055 RepID=UPI003D89BCAD